MICNCSLATAAGQIPSLNTVGAPRAVSFQGVEKLWLGYDSIL